MIINQDLGRIIFQKTIEIVTLFELMNRTPPEGCNRLVTIAPLWEDINFDSPGWLSDLLDSIEEVIV